MNQLDHARSYNIQWQDAYKKLHNLLDKPAKHQDQRNHQHIQSQVNIREIQDKKFPKIITIIDPNFLSSGPNMYFKI